MQINEDERIDYLFTDESMRIIQSPSVFSYSIDAVLLAHFSSLPKTRGKIIDLCSGNGVVPLLMSRYTSQPIDAVEIQPRLYDMAVRSIELNGKQNQITMRLGDLKDMPAMYKNDKFDLVTVNPPYFDTPSGDHYNLNEHLTIARHEVMTTLEMVIESASKLTKSGGKMALVHRPDRLVDILSLMRQYKLEPKRMQLVYPRQGKEANILLVEAVRDGRKALKVLPPFYVFNGDGQYTKEYLQLVY
ncbi:methyltransferase [Halolactibacillus alkaliphilus]|uniref:Methyltransferase n=2 Tax=Halolactibacillus alkaliphilus TaxID=442899 RepID=A0A511X4P0_9BACI|nr:methyltransferase [Halolactibacillus alkaliphilus]GGN75760.1 methyltransferase [Halolactibacillus alkaliphilus]SFP07916.1 tRNA1(Val) A37 N6-methylase TrmN6 [Halolactibacillus alkaliphilus]